MIQTSRAVEILHVINIDSVGTRLIFDIHFPQIFADKNRRFSQTQNCQRKRTIYHTSNSKNSLFSVSIYVIEELSS